MQEMLFIRLQIFKSMLNKVLNWLRSDANIFVKSGCCFNVVQSLEGAEVKSIAADFEFSSYLCRIIFWETGVGHVEVIDIDSEVTFIDEPVDIEKEFGLEIPFFELAAQLRVGDCM